MLKRLLALVACAVLLGGAAVSAQETTGSIVGAVKDATGAAVAGATVTITDVAKQTVIRTVQTDEDGNYSVPQLAAVVYDVTVEAPNFKKYVEKGVKVDVNQRRTVDAALEAGRVEEVVTVESDPLQVELQTATASTLISGDQVRELSINNRNFVQLATLAPGVTNDLADQVYVGSVNPEGQANTINISVNGGRSSQNTYLVDGADITDRGSNLTIQAFPSVDSIGEFSVLRALYPAESGRSGGGQINVVTRSGGDEFHGSLFEFVRNERLNANDFFTNQTASAGRTSDGRAKRRPFRYNNYGGTLGGPVYFFNFGEGSDRSIVKRVPRTFFFFSEEQRRDIRYPVLPVASVPDANMRLGIFPIDICLRANAPTAATATCLDVLPAGTPLSSRGLVNPVAQQYLDLVYRNLPLPTNAAARTLIASARNIADFRQEIIKIDHSVNDSISMYYRFENDKIPTLDANGTFTPRSDIPGVSTSATNAPGKTHTFQITDAVTPNTIIEGRYAYGYGAILSESVGLIARDVSPISVPLPFESTRDMIPIITGNGFNALQGFGNYDNFSWKQSFTGSLTHIRGGHTMKFGGVYSLYRKNENALAGLNQGQFSGFLNTLTTSTVQTSVLAPNAAAQEANAARRANFQSFANFLLGSNVSFTQARFDYTADFRQSNVEAFAQDEWRFRPNLTLYYGVRYSFFGPPSDRNGRLTNFIPELYDRAAAPLVTGAGNRVARPGVNFCTGLVVNAQNPQTAANCTPAVSPHGEHVFDAPTTDFAPRVGLAWDPFGKGRTSVRTGYGIYHEQVLNGWLLQVIGTNPPYQETYTNSLVRLDQPLPPGTTPSGSTSNAAPNIRAIQSDWETPYMQHWSLDVQHQLTGKTLFSAGYFGSKGTHMIGAFELNEVPPGLALNSQCAVGASTTPTVVCQAPGTTFGAGGQASAILDQLRPYRGFRSITMIQPRYNSTYHSLQLSAQQRFSGSSQANAAYTWSKNLTDNQTDRSTAPQNSYDISIEKGRATLDRRHVFSLNYIYELPFLKDQQGFLGKTLGGWQASGIINAQSGLPFTPATSNYDPAGLGFIPALIAGGRPNVLCDPNEDAPRTQQQFFNTACFEQNPTGVTTTARNVVGNAGRGIINGPPTYRVDFTMTKMFRFGENTRLQLRGEAFNVFNHTNFRTIGTNVTQATYGTVTAVRDPRTIQLGAKFYF